MAKLQNVDSKNSTTADFKTKLQKYIAVLEEVKQQAENMPNTSPPLLLPSNFKSKLATLKYLKKYV